METNNRIIETMRNRRIEPLLIFSKGYPNIQCSKETVSYRFNDLLSYCRIGLSICGMGKSHIQIIIAQGMQCCISEIQIDETTNIHRTIVLLLIRVSCIITTSPIGTPCPTI